MIWRKRIEEKALNANVLLFSAVKNLNELSTTMFNLLLFFHFRETSRRIKELSYKNKNYESVSELFLDKTVIFHILYLRNERRLDVASISIYPAAVKCLPVNLIF